MRSAINFWWASCVGRELGYEVRGLRIRKFPSKSPLVAKLVAPDLRAAGSAGEPLADGLFLPRFFQRIKTTCLRSKLPLSLGCRGSYHPIRGVPCESRLTVQRRGQLLPTGSIIPS